MSAALGLPERARQTGHPFWHAKGTTVAITEIDPGFARLREVVPQSWQLMASAKYCLDAVTTQQAGVAAGAPQSLERTSALLQLLTDDLLAIARTQARNGYRSLADQALVAAQGVSAYRATGSWPRMCVTPLAEGEPWLFCGPLAPWAMQSVHQPLTLLLVVADVEMQRAIDDVDESLSTMSKLVEDVLGSPVRLPHEVLPSMRAGDLVLAGGASASGHKHFAHFFPLDALAADESSIPFTLALTNIHRARLERCSLRLHDAVAGARRRAAVEEVVAASIGWFRSHDLSHFWSAEAPASMASADQPTLTPFERITLEEALADVLGVICAAEIFDRDALSLAFAAEMLRYISRRYREFADSAAAVLELGWLTQRSAPPPPWSDHGAWLEAAIEAFRELAPLLHHGLQTGTGPPELREAMDAGMLEVTRLLPTLKAVPTDLEYSFG